MNRMSTDHAYCPQKEINKTYRKLAKELHPDHNKAEDAHEKFELLVAAYEVRVPVNFSASSTDWC